MSKVRVYTDKHLYIVRARQHKWPGDEDDIPVVAESAVMAAKMIDNEYPDLEIIDIMHRYKGVIVGDSDD